MAVKQQRRLYDELSPGHIRVAHFRRSKKGSLRGTLESYPLADLPELQYNAISYACGDGTSRKAISLNSQETNIRLTLYDALSSILSTTRACRFSLWADEICINQNDKKEKTEQMRLMSEIYGQATIVIGWLGSPDDDSASAFDVLRIYSTLGPNQSVAGEKKRDYLLLEMMTKGCFEGTEGLARFIGPFGEPAQALSSLLQREWFHRLWIVQEVALARQLVIRCGSKELTGEEFFKGIQIRGFEHYTDPSMPFLQAIYRNAYYLSLARQAVLSGTDLPLAHLAHTFCRWKCTEAADQLNSLFGLAYRDNRSDAIITPSSTSSPAIFYKEFAVQSIRTSRTLDILHFAGLSEVSLSGSKIELYIQDPTAGIPSWVADWRLKSRPVHSLRLAGSMQPYNCTSTTADFALIADQSRTISGVRLEVSAVRIDSIEWVCPVFLPSFNNHGISFAQWISYWYREVQKHLPSHGIDEAFSSTLIMEGKLQLIERPGLTMNPDLAAVCFAQLKMRHFESFTEPDGDKLEAASENALGFVAYAEEVCRYRSLFITQKGLLGLGSAYVPIGSSIYAIHGLKTPFIVDQRTGNNILRGECYLNGAMDLGLSRSFDDVRLELS